MKIFVHACKISTHIKKLFKIGREKTEHTG